ncbi:MAG: ABC transporter substrate-binding protein [Pseudomonadota bacterium]
MEKSIKTCAVSIIFLMGLVLSPVWAGPATESLRGTINQVIKVLSDPSLQAPEKKGERRTILRDLFEAQFDEQGVARRALGAHWQERTKEEQQEFVNLFSDLLERTYFEKIDSYLTKSENFSEEDVLYLKETVGERYTVVETKVVIDKNTEIPVHYLLKGNEGNWLVCDIAIEGVSIVKNYRAQFNEILAHSSFDDLLAKLKSKQEQALN